MNYKILFWSLCILAIVSGILILTQYGSIKQYYYDYPDLPIVKKETPNEFDVSYSNRFWIHQVNTIDKLLDVKDRFNGIEMDIYYDTETKKIEVCHWPEIQPSGLYLEAMLDALQNVQDYQFWIDFKNLAHMSEQEVAESITVLDSIVSLYSIDKKNILLESSHAGNLTFFSQKGYIASYWVPSLPEYPTKHKITRWYNEVSANVKNNEISVLSGPHHMLPYVTRYFPEWDFLMFTLSPNMKIILIDE